MKTLPAWIAALVSGVCSALAQANPTVLLEVERQGDIIARGVATMIAPETLLTSNALLLLGDRWTVTDSSGRRLVGTIVARAVAADLVLLRVTGMEGTPISFAHAVPEAASAVEVLYSDGGRGRGVIVAISGDVFDHTAIHPGSQHAGPVVNGCNELVGINNLPLRRAGLGRGVQVAEPTLPIRAAALPALLRVLPEGIEVAVAGVPCPSLEDQIAALENQTRQTEEERQRLDVLRAELAGRNDELERIQSELSGELERRAGELAGVRAEAGRLAELAAERERLLAEQRAEQERLREEMEMQRGRDRSEIEARETQLQQEQQAKAQQRFILLGVASVLLAGVLATGVLLWRRQVALRVQRDQAAAARQELERVNLTFPDILLTGQFPEGGHARLKINGNALIRAHAGQILGRHPESADLVLNHPEVSRQHLRLRIEGNSLIVMDLQSFNGTLVNGKALAPEEPVAIRHGDSIQVGTIDFRVVLLK